MKISAIKRNFIFEEEMLPIYKEGNTDDAVLCIHGFTSYPGIFNEAVKSFNNAGFTASALRLPGHGTNGKDFQKARARDWLRVCIEEYLNLKSKYERVFLCGQSLGGVLALILGELFQPAGIALLSPAIFVKNKLLLLTPVLQLFIKKIYRDFEDKWEIPVIQRLKKEYWNYSWTKPSAEMLKLIRKAKRSLKKIDSPLFCILAGLDRTIKETTGVYIENKIKSSIKQTEVMNKSVHNILAGAERFQVIEKVTTWFQSL